MEDCAPRIAAALAGVIVVSAVWADDDAATPQTDGTPVTVAGVVVSIDPKTGRLRTPTQAELDALARRVPAAYGTRRSKNGPVVRHADGSLSMDLGTRSLLHRVARKHADGRIEQVCVPGHEAAQHSTDADDPTADNVP